MSGEIIKRQYVGSDVYMTQTARVTHDLIHPAVDQFNQFDSTITNASLKEFYQMIKAAEVVVADSAVIDQQVTLTENVTDLMGRARVKYGQIKYFVMKAYPTNVGIQGEFGLNDYLKARKNTNQMAQFLNEMHNACVKYEDQLIEKGCRAEEIENIQLLREKLILSNTSQKVFKKERPKLTGDRITILNNCYFATIELMAAAQFVYADDYAKRNQFVYNPTGKTNDGEDFSGEVAPMATDLVANIEYETGLKIVFRNTGTAALTFALSTSDVVEGNLVELAGGATVTKTTEELNSDGENILVRNNDSAVTGSYLVEIE